MFRYQGRSKTPGLGSEITFQDKEPECVLVEIVVYIEPVIVTKLK